MIDKNDDDLQQTAVVPRKSTKWEGIKSSTKNDGCASFSIQLAVQCTHSTW